MFVRTNSNSYVKDLLAYNGKQQFPIYYKQIRFINVTEEKM